MTRATCISSGQPSLLKLLIRRCRGQMVGYVCLQLACTYLHEDVIERLCRKTLTILENPNKAEDSLPAAKQCTQGYPGT